MTTIYTKVEEERVVSKYNTDKFDKLDSLFEDLKKDLNKVTNDSVYEKKIINIKNEFKTIYETNNTISDTLHYEFTDSILARHRKTPFERDYKISN